MNDERVEDLLAAFHDWISDHHCSPLHEEELRKVINWPDVTDESVSHFRSLLQSFGII